MPKVCCAVEVNAIQVKRNKRTSTASNTIQNFKVGGKWTPCSQKVRRFLIANTVREYYLAHSNGRHNALKHNGISQTS